MKPLYKNAPNPPKKDSEICMLLTLCSGLGINQNLYTSELNYDIFHDRKAMFSFVLHCLNKLSFKTQQRWFSKIPSQGNKKPVPHKEDWRTFPKQGDT